MDQRDQTKAGPTADRVTVFTVPTRSLALVISVVTALVAYRLLITAAETGNYEGFWFSLAHTVIVASGAFLALRSAR